MYKFLISNIRNAYSQGCPWKSSVRSRYIGEGSSEGHTKEGQVNVSALPVTALPVTALLLFLLRYNKQVIAC